MCTDTHTQRTESTTSHMLGFWINWLLKNIRICVCYNGSSYEGRLVRRQFGGVDSPLPSWDLGIRFLSFKVKWFYLLSHLISLFSWQVVVGVLLCNLGMPQACDAPALASLVLRSQVLLTYLTFPFLLPSLLLPLLSWSWDQTQAQVHTKLVLLQWALVPSPDFSFYLFVLFYFVEEPCVASSLELVI